MADLLEETEFFMTVLAKAGLSEEEEEDEEEEEEENEEDKVVGWS